MITQHSNNTRFRHKLIRLTRTQSSEGVLIEHLQIMPKDDSLDSASDELKKT